MAEESNKEKVEEEKLEAKENAAVQETDAKSDDKSERSSLENLRVLENIDVKLTVEVGGAEIKLR